MAWTEPFRSAALVETLELLLAGWIVATPSNPENPNSFLIELCLSASKWNFNELLDGRPEGKGFITELQRQKLKPAHLEVIVQKNKERNHYPKRVSDEKWKEVKKELKRKQYGTQQVAGKNQKLKDKKTAKSKKKTKDAVVPSAEPPQNLRKSTRNKKKS